MLLLSFFFSVFYFISFFFGRSLLLVLVLDLGFWFRAERALLLFLALASEYGRSGKPHSFSRCFNTRTALHLASSSSTTTPFPLFLFSFFGSGVLPVCLRFLLACLAWRVCRRQLSLVRWSPSAFILSIARCQTPTPTLFELSLPPDLDFLLSLLFLCSWPLPVSSNSQTAS